MASIDLRGWRIQSDPECWTLGRPKTRLNKKQEHEIWLAHPTYYPTLAAALQGLLERELRESDVKGLQAVMELIQAVQADIQRSIPA